MFHAASDRVFRPLVHPSVALLLVGLTVPIAAPLWAGPRPSEEEAAEDEAATWVVREIEGWKVSVDPALFDEANQEEGERALDALANHLQRIRFILPADKVAELQQLPIHIDWDHSLSNMQYHPSAGWLRRNGHSPELAKHVHIPRARRLLARDQWAKHPYVVLHELAHAYHDQVLDFNNEEIEGVFENAKASGQYEDVLLHSGRRGRHYGLSNAKEFFAEATESFLGVNDFYPFVRAELQEFDPRTYELMVRIWGPIR